MKYLLTCLKSRSCVDLGPKLLNIFAVHLYIPFQFDLYVSQQTFDECPLSPFYIEREV